MRAGEDSADSQLGECQVWLAESAQNNRPHNSAYRLRKLSLLPGGVSLATVKDGLLAESALETVSDLPGVDIFLLALAMSFAASFCPFSYLTRSWILPLRSSVSGQYSIPEPGKRGGWSELRNTSTHTQNLR